MTARPSRTAPVGAGSVGRFAILAAALLWLANPPVGAWPLAWIAVAPLIVSVTRANRMRQAIWRGYVFGLVFLGAIWYWIGTTVVVWTGSEIGWVAWLGMTVVLALFYAAWAGAAWWMARRSAGIWRVVAHASAWVVMEWARTLGPAAMPWAQLSYTQFHVPAVLQVADLTGAYGVSFVIMLVNGAAATWWTHREGLDAKRPLYLAATAVLLTLAYGLARIAMPDAGAPERVVAFQPDFPVFQSEADVPAQEATIVTDAQRAWREESGRPNLFVWPESAAPRDAVNDWRERSDLALLAKRLRTGIAIGSRVDHSVEAEANASVFFPPDGRALTEYDKRHLVLFGETIPFRALIPGVLRRAFQLPGDLTPGTAATVFRFTDRESRAVAAGPLICFESMFPGLTRDTVNAGANVLLSQSNDSWSRSHAAMEQDLAGVVLRAIETRRSVIRATSSGITCLVDSRGHVQARAPVDSPAYLVGVARLSSGRTLYTRLGDWFVLACGLAVVYACVAREQGPNAAP